MASRRGPPARPDALAMSGRVGEARSLYERLLGLRNDLGLISEEYDVDRGRMVGNFPQAFTHLAMVDSAHRLDAAPSLARAARGTRSPAAAVSYSQAP